ncbi:MAG: DUF1015 family protein [Candidatus Electrothrix sp. EH2]|nr:DUF1015 family protein [Candidatus Electrothrix sp. EH2]
MWSVQEQSPGISPEQSGKDFTAVCKGRPVRLKGVYVSAQGDTLSRGLFFTDFLRNLIVIRPLRKADVVFLIYWRTSPIILLQSSHTPLLFLLNPTKVEQVLKVADSDNIMPHKSTYFYPKIMTGLLLNKLDNEHIQP